MLIGIPASGEGPVVAHGDSVYLDASHLHDRANRRPANMNYSDTFARHFARLVWLLLHEPANVDEQKGALRALVTVVRDGDVALDIDDGALAANGVPVPALLSGVSELVEQMRACRIHTIHADAGATPADILGVARRLADVAGAITGPTVRLLGRDSPVPMPRPRLDGGEIVEDAPEHMYERFTTLRAPIDTALALLAQLEAATGAAVVTRILDDLARAAEEAAQDGHVALASEIFHRIVLRERANQDFESKRAFVLTVRRLSTAPLLRAVSVELVKSPLRRDEHMAVLSRAGEDGADALIEQLVAATERSDRRVYFDALVELRAGVPTLLHMLGDPRWFVARNAAALLGDLQAREAEGPLGELLHHDDERVRHAATIALMRLGTPRSMPAIEQALKDGAPQIRMQAAAALSERNGGVSAVPLLRALDAERDDEVKTAFLIALGRLASPPAVKRLIAVAQPERRLFHRKVAALRIAAVQGLANAGTPEALDALCALQEDKEVDVRQAVLHALTRAVGDAWRPPEP